MNEISDILLRVKELTVQSANDTNVDADRQAIQDEINNMLKEIDRIANETEVNTMKVMNNSFGNSGIGKTLSDIIGWNKVTSSSYLGDTVDSSIIPNFSNTTTGFKSTGTLTWTTIYANDPTNPIITSGGKREYTVYQTPSTNVVNVVNGSDSKGSYTSTLTETITDIQEQYAGASLNFDGLGTDYQLTDLYKQGFNSTCATCNNHYSIRFKEGNDVTMVKDLTNYILDIGIDGVKNGNELVDRIMNAFKEPSAAAIVNHYTQYASDGTKLYLYDNRPYILNSGFKNASFSPTVYYSNEIIERNPFYIQTGANRDQAISMYLPWMTTDQLGLEGLDVTSHSLASKALTAIGKAIKYTSSERASVGAYQNRLEFAMKIAENSEENLQAAESQIRDANISEEMLGYAKTNILQEAAQAMMSHAKAGRERVLDLL